VFTVVYGPCTRRVHDCVHGRVHGRVGIRPTARVHARVCTRHVHAAVYVYGQCTGRVPYTWPVHGRLHGPYTAMYTPRTWLSTRVHARVHGPSTGRVYVYTRPCISIYQGCEVKVFRQTSQSQEEARGQQLLPRLTAA